MKTKQPASRKVALILQAMQPFLDGMLRSPFMNRPTDRPISDFMAGNPQEMTLPGFVAALTRWSVPRDKDWFAYKMMDRPAQEVAAAALSERLGPRFDPDDVFLSRGASGALALGLHLVVDPGDEVIFISPPWFFYEAMILASGATPVRVRVDPVTFDLDVDAIARAIGERTRVVIVNTPHNPTGKIYPAETLERLAAVLSAASERNGRPIYLLSDESYSRILFDGNPFHTPARFYPSTFLAHTYSKSALAPGQRLGFLAMPPSMPDREELRFALLALGLADGVGTPDAVMQYALPEIDRLSIDLAHLQRKRDRMVRALRAQGYDLHVPEGTFYLLPRSPIADDRAFVELLARDDVYVLPGRAVEMPGYLRISLTATDEMIERALPVFERAIAEAR